MSEFPKDELGMLALRLANERNFSASALVLDAINRHEELAERCVMDRTRDSITIAELRAAMQETLDNWTALVAKIRRGEL